MHIIFTSTIPIIDDEYVFSHRWSLIAGRIPGRTAEEIEKYWNSRHSTRE